MRRFLILADESAMVEYFYFYPKIFFVNYHLIVSHIIYYCTLFREINIKNKNNKKCKLFNKTIKRYNKTLFK